MAFTPLPPAGRMKHPVMIQTPPTGTGTRGQRSGSWVNAETVYASIKTLRGRELEQAQSRYERAEKEVLMYATGTLTTSECRLVYDGRIFNIGYIENVDENGTMYKVVVSEET